MAYFTFDTAWIVAHMQNSNNEAQKAVIRQRMANLRCQDQARWNREAFEQFCYAWKHGVLEPALDPPAVDPFPYLDHVADRNVDAPFYNNH